MSNSGSSNNRMQTRSNTRNRITRTISVDLPRNLNSLRSTRSSSVGAVSENCFVRPSRHRENDLPPLIEENDGVLHVSIEQNEVQNDVQAIQINIRQPVILLQRLSDDLINLHCGSDDISSQSSASTQSQPLVFNRFEFVSGTKSNTRLLFVHDIEHLYFLRNVVKNGTVYACRNRKKCSAKVIIDASGACKQYGTESHTHPSVAEDYANLLVMSEVDSKCSQVDVLRHQTVRSVFDRATVEYVFFLFFVR